MALILQLETSTITCSVALSLNGETLSFKEVDERNIHASHLTLFIEEVMRNADKKMQDLDAVAVSMGPGSYTGLRIGVSAAKGLCYALDIPVIGINTLEAMTSGFTATRGNTSMLYCPMIDARRMEVYTAVFNSKMDMIQPVEAKIIDASSFENLFQNNQITFFGDGATKCMEVLGGNNNAFFVSDFTNSARDLNQLALEKFQKGYFEDTAYFEPFYLKDFLVTQPKKSL